jgi:predicted secreted hydrolase
VSRSSLVTSRRVRGVAIAAVAAAALAVAIPRASSAATNHPHLAAVPTNAAAAVRDASVPDPGFPTFVHLPADQAAHPSVPNESWYAIGHLSSRGHEYGYEVVVTSAGGINVAVTDITAAKYYIQETLYKPSQLSLSATKLDVCAPNVTLSGPMNAMHLTATLPAGSLDLQLNAQRRVLYNNGTGLFPFLGGTSYYYSLPNLRSSGTLTLNGKTSAVTGESWLDRQWGTWDWGQVNKWTWMAIQLDNGDAVNLWDRFSKQGVEEHWATVLHRDGSETVASVTPLAKYASNFETSPASGQRYATKWIVEIPGLATRFTVAASPPLQELTFFGAHTEAASKVYGRYQGKPITGQAYVEQLGAWK